MEANGNRYQQGASIPNCSVGQMLTMYVGFPQCWDGKNLESVNGRSHMTYGTWRPNKSTPGGCPATHPVGLPFIEFFVRYTVSDPRGSGGWKLSSDDYSSGPGGYSGHADYIFAWDENAFPKVRQYCYIEQYDCGYSFGDGTAPRAVRDWSGDLIKRENYPF